MFISQQEKVTPLFPFFGDDNRGKATGWSLFGDVHVTAAQHSGNVSTIQSLNTTVDEMKKLVGTGAGFASAVAGFLGEHEFAHCAGALEQRLLK